MQARRSILFMPGTNTRAMEKARHLHADCVVFDLEDAVDDAHAERARKNIGDALLLGSYAPREILVRINHPQSPMFLADMHALSTWTLDGVVVPKVESAADVSVVCGDLATPRMTLWAMIETPKGVREVEAITQALRENDALVMGTQDLAKQLRLPAGFSEPGLDYSLSRCLVAARAANLTIIDGVYPRFQDPDGFARQCGRARKHGFDGKSLIHPNQIATCNDHFSPTLDEVEASRSLIDAWHNAGGDSAASGGVVSFEGRMIEALHVKAAQALLAYHEMLAARFCDTNQQQ